MHRKAAGRREHASPPDPGRRDYRDRGRRVAAAETKTRAQTLHDTYPVTRVLSVAGPTFAKNAGPLPPRDVVFLVVLFVSPPVAPVLAPPVFQAACSGRTSGL